MAHSNLQSNLPMYKAQASVSAKYAPLIQRGKFLHEQVSKAVFPERRSAGDTNLDLWLDGSIYPINVQTGKHPRFNSLKDLIEFVGDGESGLFGYINSLVAQNDSHSKVVEISILRERVKSFEREIEIFEGLAQKIPDLESKISSLQSELTYAHSHILGLSADLVSERATNSALHASHAREHSELQESHASQLGALQQDIVRTTAALKRLSNKLEGMRKTPWGYRSQTRKRRDLGELSQSGGHAKAQRRILRSIVGAQTTSSIQEHNATEGRTSRLHGDTHAQMQTGRVFGSFMSRVEVETMLQSPRLNMVGSRIAKHYLEKIGQHVGPEQIVETCDRSGITQSGYGAIYKTFKKAVACAGAGSRVSCLPAPYKVSKLREELNKNLKDLIGDYYSISNLFEIPPSAKSKAPQKIVLSPRNSFFVDIEVVQQTMIRLYNITPAGLFQFISNWIFSFES
jgi:hypothetical protein